MPKKKILIEIDENNKYYDFIEGYRKERELSFTACAKQLIFDRVDDLIEREARISGKIQFRDESIVNNQTKEIKDEQPKEKKKDMLKNLNRIKKG